MCAGQGSVRAEDAPCGLQDFASRFGSCRPHPENRGSVKPAPDLGRRSNTMTSDASAPPLGNLRALTFLAPGIPRPFFELLCRHLSARLGLEVALDAESRYSGPMRGDPDPFRGAAASADVGFLCASSYLWLRSRNDPSVELVPAGLVFADARLGARPLYFSDFVVRTDDPAQSFADLEGRTWGYNDRCSLSGYFATLQHLAEMHADPETFARSVCTGSHHGSLAAVLDGAIDGAAIDSNVLALARLERPQLAHELRVIESFGPFPIQPLVVRADLGPLWKQRIANALLDVGGEASLLHGLQRFGLAGFAPIDDEAYDEERCALRELGSLED